MFNSQTIYVLNRFDDRSIAYDDAFGKITLITAAADFSSEKEFRKWKNWDRMKKTHEQRKDNVHRNHTLSMTDKENEIGITPSTEAVMIAKEVRAEAIQQAANSMKGPLREFCVSAFRQNQEYHVFNVQDEGLFPLSKFLPVGWDGMRAGTA